MTTLSSRASSTPEQEATLYWYSRFVDAQTRYNDLRLTMVGVQQMLKAKSDLIAILEQQNHSLQMYMGYKDEQEDLFTAVHDMGEDA